MASRKGAGLDAGVVERMGVRWTKIAKASRVIPHGGKGEGAGVVGGEAKAYTFRVFELSKVAVPKFILDKGTTSGGQQKVQVHLTATLFDTETKKFFGSTWAGKRLDMAKCCKASNEQVKWNGQEAARACNIELGPDYGFSFCSAANLENVRLAVEVVMTEVDSTGSIRGQEYSICWTAMKLSAKRDLEKFVYARAAEGELTTGTPIYFGTPRVLMYVGADPKLLSKAKVEKAEARHILMTHLKLEEAAKALMVQDELVDGVDLWCVPGLNDQARIMDSAGAKVAASCPIALHGLTVDAGDGLEARLEEYIKVSSGQSFNFKELCVEVGVHNGRRFIGSEGLHKFGMSKSGSKWTVKEQIKLDGYIPNNAIAVVILVHAVGSMKGDDDTRVCIGWLPVVAVEASGDKGPIVTGDYSTSLLSQAPMPCVSHALVYSEGDMRPKLTMTLKNAGGGVAEVAMSKKVSEAKALKEAAAAAAIEEGEWESDDEPAPSERSKVASHKGTAGASGKASSAAPSDADLAETASEAAAAPGGKAPILEPAQATAAAAATPAHKAVVNSKGELTEFTLACNTSALPGESKGMVEVDALEMDMNLKDILKELEEELGRKVSFRYSPFDKAGNAMSPIQVDSEAKLDALKDTLEDDLEGLKMYNGRIEVEVYPADEPAPAAVVTPAPPSRTPAATPAATAQTPAATGIAASASTPAAATTTVAAAATPAAATPAAAAAGVAVPAAGTPVAASGGRTTSAASSSARKAASSSSAAAPASMRKALAEVALLCGTSKLDGKTSLERVGDLPVDWTWVQVRKELKDVFGRDVVVEYQDENEKTLMVDSEQSWRTLVADLQSDWQGDRDLNGEMDCQLLPDPASIQPVPPAGGRASRGRVSSRSSREDVPTIKGLTNAPDENETPQTRSGVRAGGALRQGNGGAGLTARSTDGSDIESARGERQGIAAALRRSHPHHMAVDEDVEFADGDDSVRRSASRSLAAGSSTLSRALKARLFSTSVSGVVDGYQKEVPFVETGSAHMDLSRDASDVHRAHEIAIQIVAVKLPMAHKKVFFTFSFYQFGLTQTKTGVIDRSGGEKEGEAAMLKVDNSPGGVSVNFSVDPYLDSNAFARYLAARILQVEVWDGDSLLPLGCFHLDLRPLLRGGREAVQTAGEHPIIDSSSFSSSAPPGDVRGSLVGIPRTSVSDMPAEGSAFVRMVNIGRPSARSSIVTPESDAHPASSHGPSRVLPLIDEPTMQPQGSPSKGLKTDLSPSRGMAILYANRPSVQAALKQRGFAEGAAVPPAALQEAAVSCRMDMTARQLASLCSHLSDETGGNIDLGLLYMPGEEKIALIPENDRTKARMRELAASLAGAVAERFGGPVRAFGKYTSAGEDMGGGQLAELLRDVGVTMTEGERSMMVRSISGGSSPGQGVSRAQFEAFLTVGLRGTAAKGGSGAGDSERKMARWRRVRASRRQGWGEPADEEKQILVDAAKMMRETHKEGKIKAFLQSCITTTQVLRASFGETQYFQYPLRNPYSEDRVILISFSDPELHVVTDSAEWRALNAAWGYGGRVEDDMFAKEAGGGLSVWLQGHQEILVPFKFITYASGQVSVSTDGVSGAVPLGVVDSASAGADQAKATSARKIEVKFSARRPNGAGDPMYLLNVEVEPQPLVVDHSFRFYHGQNDFLKKRILVDSAASGQGGGWRQPPGSEGAAGGRGRQPKFAWCSDSSVIMASSGHSGQPGMDEVLLKCRVGAAGTTRSFYVVVYEDQHCTSVFEIWRVTVHSVHRMDIQGLVGQTEREGCSLTLRTQGAAKKVIAMSSHPKELSVDKEGSFEIGSALTEVPIRYTPMQPGRKDVLVHFIEEGTNAASPISAWLLVTRAKVPVVNKRYDIRIATGKPSSKKIMYTNPYSIDRTFKLRTDKPSLLTLRDPRAELEVAAKASQYISLRFSACQRACTQDILLFVNDEDDKNEECLCISVTYY